MDTTKPSTGLPPVRRLRLRGDWSDTGPDARPEREAGTSAGRFYFIFFSNLIIILCDNEYFHFELHFKAKTLKNYK